MRSGKLTKERLLDETTKLVQTKGFGATSLNELLAVAGIKKGSLYYHFTDKDHLGLAVLERAKTRFLESLDELLFTSTPTISIHKFLDFVLDRHRKKGFTGGCLFGNTALEMSDADNRYAVCVSDLFQEWITRIEAVILSGQQAGEFRSDIPAADLAQVFVSTIEGGIMMSRLKKEEGPLKTCLETLMTFLRAEQRQTSNSSQ
ncbi:MAG: TetR/AcrR family transcriptional regulator [Candidatus Omnitrophota bacterium]